MRRHDALFIFLTGLSVTLLGLAVAETITRDPQQALPAPTVQAPASSEALREQFIRKGLPLHAGKYWRPSHE